MKKSIKTLTTITIMTVTITAAYLLGTTQTETITKEVKTEKIVEVIPNGYIDTTTEDFYNNYVDMRQVVDFETTETGLYLYMTDGSGYYWER